MRSMRSAVSTADTLSTELAGGMTGRMVGVWCSSGNVLFRAFEYVGSNDPAALDLA